MSGEITLFSVGDIITWNPERERVRLIVMKERGEGPFRVDRVEKVPDVCGCGIPREDPTHIFLDGCDQTLRESVGHTQWLNISKEGQCIKDELFTGQPQRFSGAWFIKVPSS